MPSSPWSSAPPPAGARALTGSSGVGVTYAFETYSPIAGGRIPLQMMIADRALDPPGDFGSEHTDAMSTRDQGWIMGWAENPQEAFDNCLINYRVGEDHRVLLPQIVCQDGYFVSHIPGKVVLPEQSQVDEFLPPYKLPHPLDPHHPVSHGPQIRPDQGTVMDMQRAQAMLDTPAVIKEAIEDFNRIFGRKYSPFVEEFMTDDAEMAFFIQGAHTMTARHAVRHLRSQGREDRPGEAPLRAALADPGSGRGPVQVQGGRRGRDQHLLRRRHAGREPPARGPRLPVRRARSGRSQPPSWPAWAARWCRSRSSTTWPTSCPR